MVSEKFNTDILYLCIYCINVYIVIYIIVIYVSPLYIFTFSVSENEEQLRRLPIRSSGFHSAQNGIIRKIDTTKERHSIFCQNDAYLGSYNNVSVNELQCQPCTEYGAPIKSTNDVWSIPPLSPLSTTVPVLLLVLVSRSSSGASIKKKTYKHLQQFIVN